MQIARFLFLFFRLKRVTIAFFAVSGLDILNCLDALSDEKRKEICDWVYRHQIVPGKLSKYKCGGFQGSTTINVANGSADCGTEKYKWGHLAITYTAIAILITLGDDLSRLNRKDIVDGVAAVQREDGSFSASVEGNEHDMRFVYCAAAICSMLDDWSGVDRKKMAKYIRDSIVSNEWGRNDNGWRFTMRSNTFPEIRFRCESTL